MKTEPRHYVNRYCYLNWIYVPKNLFDKRRSRTFPHGQFPNQVIALEQNRHVQWIKPSAAIESLKKYLLNKEKKLVQIRIAML